MIEEVINLLMALTIVAITLLAHTHMLYRKKSYSSFLQNWHLPNQVTATSRPTSPIGWISIHVVGNLTSMDGIPTTRWKSIQWMEIPPRVGWISIHLSQNGWMEIQPSFGQRQTRFYDQFSNFLLFLFGVFKTMKVKVDYNSLEFGDFLQLRWGTLLSSIVRR